MDTSSPRFLNCFELLRAHAAYVTVTAGSIVEADVIGDIAKRQLTGFVNLLLDPFLLEAAEEGLRDGIDAQQLPLRLMLGSR